MQCVRICGPVNDACGCSAVTGRRWRPWRQRRVATVVAHDADGLQPRVDREHDERPVREVDDPLGATVELHHAVDQHDAEEGRDEDPVDDVDDGGATVLRGTG